MKFKNMLLILSCLLLSACSDDNQSYAENDSQSKPAPAKLSDENVFKGQIDALEKAKGVESTIQSGLDQHMKAVD
jgi:outer membrane biogenesis lipoprotein LolB